MVSPGGSSPVHPTPMGARPGHDCRAPESGWAHARFASDGAAEKPRSAGARGERYRDSLTEAPEVWALRTMDYLKIGERW